MDDKGSKTEKKIGQPDRIYFVRVYYGSILGLPTRQYPHTSLELARRTAYDEIKDESLAMEIDIKKYPISRVKASYFVDEQTILVVGQSGGSDSVIVTFTIEALMYEDLIRDWWDEENRDFYEDDRFDN